ncbi:MAG: hypothetical protein COB65_10935 [Thalassobium sp.]|nr:MAG: hypothetical protein COB65_10935 [Thalassobium sp.]
MIPTPELALLFGYNEPSASFYDFCRRTGIAPVPGRRGWYDPKLIRARLDAVQGISAAEREATSQPSLVAQRRARRAQK